jgi:hypothetical protein
VSGSETTDVADALLRRRRFAAPQPRGNRIDLSDADVAVFAALARHGPLPTHYLFRFSGRANFNSFQHRLTKLYNGAGEDSYLIRPSQQFASFRARYQHVVYDLAAAARRILRERGDFSTFIRRTDPFLHRLMGACVGASIELGCKDIRYISRGEILSRKGNRLELPLSMSSDKIKLVPDDLFGLKWDQSVRFFAVEIDRNTESITRKQVGSTTFTEKLRSYLSAMRSQVYHEQWAIRNLSVLVVTTSDRHAANLKERVHVLDGSLATRFYFRCVPQFGINWRVPPILNLLEGLTESRA